MHTVILDSDSVSLSLLISLLSRLCPNGTHIGMNDAEQFTQEDLTNRHLLLLSTCTFEFEDTRGMPVDVIT